MQATRERLLSLLALVSHLCLSLFQRRAVRRFLRAHPPPPVVGGASAGAAGALWPPLRRVAALAHPPGAVGATARLGGFVALCGASAWVGLRWTTADAGAIDAFVRDAMKTPAVARAVAALVGWATLGATVGAAMEHARFSLIAEYRHNVTTHFHARAMARGVYFRGAAVEGTLPPLPPLVTQWAGELAEHLAELPLYYLQPVCEIAASTWIMSKTIGWKWTAAVSAIAGASAWVVRRAAPPFGRIHATLLDAEAALAKMHTELEGTLLPVALYGAEERQRRLLDRNAAEIYRAQQAGAASRGIMKGLEGMNRDVLWELVALLISTASISAQNQRTIVRDFVVRRRAIASFFYAVSTFTTNIRELSHLAEFTYKVDNFDAALRSVEEEERRVRAHNEKNRLDNTNDQLFVLSDVTVAAPGGAVLIADLTLPFSNVDTDVAVVGPNGCGKSSLLRILTGLWEPRSGTLVVHPRVDFVVLTQRTYLPSNNTLVDLVRFPLPHEAPLAEVEEGWVRHALEIVGGNEIVDILGGEACGFVGFHNVDTSYDWMRLSGGQREKVVCARGIFLTLKSFHHRRLPIVLIDEATSQLDIMSEAAVYAEFRKLGAKIISVTHKPELAASHSQILELTADPSQRSLRRNKAQPLSGTWPESFDN